MDYGTRIFSILGTWILRAGPGWLTLSCACSLHVSAAIFPESKARFSSSCGAGLVDFQAMCRLVRYLSTGIDVDTFTHIQVSICTKYMYTFVVVSHSYVLPRYMWRYILTSPVGTCIIKVLVSRAPSRASSCLAACDPFCRSRQGSWNSGSMKAHGPGFSL